MVMQHANAQPGALWQQQPGGPIGSGGIAPGGIIGFGVIAPPPFSSRGGIIGNWRYMRRHFNSCAFMPSLASAVDLLISVWTSWDMV